MQWPHCKCKSSFQERVPQVRALAGDPVLCFWARHLTLTVYFSTWNYKPANCWGNVTNCGGMTCDGLASVQGKSKYSLPLLATESGMSFGSYEPITFKASFYTVDYKLSNKFPSFCTGLMEMILALLLSHLVFLTFLDFSKFFIFLQPF